jgi:hypothetical protein
VSVDSIRKEMAGRDVTKKKKGRAIDDGNGKERVCTGSQMLLTLKSLCESSSAGAALEAVANARRAACAGAAARTGSRKAAGARWTAATGRRSNMEGATAARRATAEADRMRCMIVEEEEGEGVALSATDRSGRSQAQDSGEKPQAQAKKKTKGQPVKSRRQSTARPL